MINSLQRARVKARKARSIKSRENDELRRWLTSNGFNNWVSVSIDPDIREFEVELNEGLILFEREVNLESMSPKERRRYSESLAEDDSKRLDIDDIRREFERLLGKQNVYSVIYSSKRRLPVLSDDDDSNAYGRAQGAPSTNIVRVTGKLPKGARSIRAIDFDDDGNEKSFKMFNLLWVNEQLGAVMSELSTEAKREPEIAAALSCMLAAKQLFSAYEERIGGTPFKAVGDSPVADQLRGFARQINSRRSVIDDNFMVEIEDVLDEEDFPSTRSIEGLMKDIQADIIRWREASLREKPIHERSLVSNLDALAEQVEVEGDNGINFGRRSLVKKNKLEG